MAAASNAPLQGYSVQVVSKTWARDRHNLFDFEASQQDLLQQEFTVSESAACFRSGTDVEVKTKLKAIDTTSTETQCLLRFVRKGSSFRLEKPTSSSSSSLRPWLVVRDMPNGQHIVREGDGIRLGCVRLKVRQLVLSSKERECSLNLPMEPSCVSNPLPDAEMKDKICRICMCDGPGEDDPLIAPCSCKGSVEYVHVGCLRQWINVRRNARPSASSFLHQGLHCDLCKTPYVNAVTDAQGQVAPLVTVPEIKAPYAVLELKDRRADANSVVHVVSFADQKLCKLGRAHDSDVRIQDPSISRWHASLRLSENGIALEDHESKFGTCVELSKKSELDLNRPVSVQIGRTLLQLSPDDALTGDEGSPTATSSNVSFS